ncbi:serine/threonine protein kinase [Oscillatoria salina IIICB1]|uniref:protein kinase domain-containing protein n=1 Tax=Oscillatoria salina TaxID=331517 RepID=UPI0013B849FB|nr:serine/threonine protein kinase [Oscillatoria salina IIICB1]NET86981.1 serine/threonine protein kinase [Kamptonema sp. SIO1D9]
MSYCLNPNCPNPQNPETSKFCLTCGQKLLLKDRYRAKKPLGQGGFGKTFLATDEDKPSKPLCVIKQFLPQAQGTSTLEKAAELFEREAIRLDELGKHPQIPDLLAYFIQDNQQYLVQEFIAGDDLGKVINKEGNFNETQIRGLLNNLLPVLQFVHQHQVIHRDIKPENIIRRTQDRQLFLVDFGAAKAVTTTSLHKTGTSIGSAGYVSPEQAIGRATFASDLYSLGVTCIYLLTEVPPMNLFDPGDGNWIWRDFLREPVSDNLGKILTKMLAGGTNRRYQTAGEIIKDLQSQIPTNNSVPKTAAKIVATSAQNQAKPANQNPIYSELLEIKSEFGQTGKQKQPNSPKQKSSSNSTRPKSQIDLELEQLKSEFREGNK